MMKKTEKAEPSGFKVILKALLTGILVAAAIPCALMVLVEGIDLWHAIIADTVIDPKAAEYIQQNYPEHDFELEEAYYAFKDNAFVVKVRSRSSQDTHFALTYDSQTYRLQTDNYERMVLGGINTRARLTGEYDALIREALGGIPEPYSLEAGFCEYSEGTGSAPMFSPRGLKTDTLEVDGVYDVAAMGSEYGYLEICLIEQEENIHIQGALDYLLEIDRILTEKGIGYYVLELRMIDDTYPNTSVEFSIYNVTKEDLNSEDPLARLQELWNEQEAKRQAIKAAYEHNDAEDS